MTKPIRILFIAGASRSGSTLLDRVLGSLPGVTSLGELHQVWRRGFQENQFCGCGLAFDSCSFWGAVRQDPQVAGRPDIQRILSLQRRVVRDRNMPAELFPWPQLPERRQLRDSYVDALTRLYRAITATSGASVMVDSSKRPIHGMLLQGREDVDLRVVHLIRDSRAVAYSLARRKEKTDANDQTVMMQRRTSTQSAKSWLRQNVLAEALATRSATSMRIRYEDFLADPIESVSRLAEFAGLSGAAVPHLTDRMVRLSTAHTVSGNPMRLETGWVPLTLDDEWRRSMRKQDRTTVTWMTSPLLIRYGYRLGSLGS